MRVGGPAPDVDTNVDAARLGACATSGDRTLSAYLWLMIGGGAGYASSVDAFYYCGLEFPEGAHVADAVPGVFFARGLALAFVAL